MQFGVSHKRQNLVTIEILVLFFIFCYQKRANACAWCPNHCWQVSVMIHTLKVKYYYFADGWFKIVKLWSAIIKKMPENGLNICYLAFINVPFIYHLNAHFIIAAFTQRWCFDHPSWVRPELWHFKGFIFAEYLNFYLITGLPTTLLPSHHSSWMNNDPLFFAFCLVLPHPIVLFSSITQSRQG